MQQSVGAAGGTTSFDYKDNTPASAILITPCASHTSVLMDNTVTAKKDCSLGGAGVSSR
jgi:hypothetical protein